MSGGAKIPNAPNLSGNVNQANQTAGTATSDANQLMQTSLAYNKNAQTNLAGVTNTSNSMAGQLGAQAHQNISQYGSTFAPLQAQQAQQAQAYGSDANIQRLQGQAVAGANTANQAARSNSAAALAAEGVDPASVHGAALDRQNSITGAGQVGAAGTQSAVNTMNTANALTNQANQLGMQVGQQGMQGASTAAGTAQAGQLGVNQTNSSGISNLGASNQYLNTATNANAGAVSANQAQFGDQNQVFQNQQAQQNSNVAGITGAIGAAGMFMEGGGIVGEHLGGFLPNSSSSLSGHPHSGLPVRRSPMPRQPGIPMHFTPMDMGGPVGTQGALPAGTFGNTTDRKPAMLTPGEFVLPRDVVAHMGSERLHKLIDSTREKSNLRRASPIPWQPHRSGI
jgi:hypothetical protein